MSAISHKVWWKERLPKIDHVENSLSAKNWNFIEDEAGNTNMNASTAQQESSRTTNSAQKCFKMRKNEAKSVRSKCMNEIEKEIIEHPLAMFPHYEASMPADIFEDVLAVLDPEMLKAKWDDLFVDTQRHDDFTEPYEFFPQNYNLPDDPKWVDPEVVEQERVLALMRGRLGGSTTQKVISHNPYKSILKSGEVKNKKKNNQNEKPTVPAIEDVSSPITNEFCDWFNNLSNDDFTVSPEGIGSFFVSGYEKKPSLKVPLVELDSANVPKNLKQSSTDTEEKEKQSEKPKTEKKMAPCYKNTAPRPKYGAWYLSPKKWQKFKSEGHVTANIDDKAELLTEDQIASIVLDQELSTLRGTKLFQNYIEMKKSRMPEFMQRVIEIQADREKQEAMMALQQLEKKKKKIFPSL